MRKAEEIFIRFTTKMSRDYPEYEIKDREGFINAIEQFSQSVRPTLSQTEAGIKGTGKYRQEDGYTLTTHQAYVDGWYDAIEFINGGIPTNNEDCNHILGANDESGVCVKCGKKVTITKIQTQTILPEEKINYYPDLCKCKDSTYTRGICDKCGGFQD